MTDDASKRLPSVTDNSLALAEDSPTLPPIFSVAEALELGDLAYGVISNKRANIVERAELCEVAGASITEYKEFIPFLFKDF
jgi:hypothetical protein